MHDYLRKIFNDQIFYLFLGVIIAIAVARLYVFLGGSVNISYNGIVIHHFFIGIILLIITGFIMFLLHDHQLRMRKLRNFLAMLFGFGVGLIIDEANFFISAGQIYTLSQYYSSYNLYSESIIVITILVILVLSLLFNNKDKAR
ncbi:hypothetical protein M1293_02685 [Candidatus Parvarchaeota archaeon]|nr:hypothetical protein [Candidatus Parvarchaeota archaeon]